MDYSTKMSKMKRARGIQREDKPPKKEEAAQGVMAPKPTLAQDIELLEKFVPAYKASTGVEPYFAAALSRVIEAARRWENASQWEGDFSAQACPHCKYEQGIFKGSCVWHREVERLKRELDEARAVALSGKLCISEQHKALEQEAVALRRAGERLMACDPTLRPVEWLEAREEWERARVAPEGGKPEDGVD